MTIIHKTNPYDQLLSIVNNGNGGIPDLHALSADSILDISLQGQSENKISEQAQSRDSGRVAVSNYGDDQRDDLLEESENRKAREEKFHRVPASFIKEVGVDCAAVLYGFSLILKSHKSNLHNGLYWYYDSLDQLLLKRWPYLKRTSLFEIVNTLREKELLLISKENKKNYDRTLNYSMNMSKIDQVLEDKQFLFDTNIAHEHGILAALLFHKIRYEIRMSRIKEIENNHSWQYHPKVSELASIFSVSKSTIKRQLGILVKEGLLAKGNKKGYYALSGNLDSFENGSNPNGKIQKLPVFRGDKDGSNPNEDRSFPNEMRSNPNKKGSNPNDNTIYETNLNHIGNQMRSASRVFLKKEGTEESCIHSEDHPNIDKDSGSEIESDQIEIQSVNRTAFVDRNFNSEIYSFLTHSEPASDRPKTVMEPFPVNSKIDYSGMHEKDPKTGFQDHEISQCTISAEVSLSENSSVLIKDAQGPESCNRMSSFASSSDSIPETKHRARKIRQIVSFGRKIEDSESSRFSKIVQENEKIAKELSNLEFMQRDFIRESL